MENFTQLHYILVTLLLGYGLTLGFRNTVMRIIATLSTKTLNQNALGKLLDGLFYAGIAYLVLVFTGVIK